MVREVADGTLGGEFNRTDRADLQSRGAAAEEAAKDDGWGGYRFVGIAGLKLAALLNRSVGAGYIDRNWPHLYELGVDLRPRA